MSSDTDTDTEPEVKRWERRFFWPVVLAALAAIPAMFLTMLDGPFAIAGEVINYASAAVFTAETVVLLVLARDKWKWVREHWFIVTVTGLTIPAVLLAMGPVQILRLVRVIGALRIIRVGRIVKAGRILYQRSDLSGPVRASIAVAATVCAAAFVALVLADPTAHSRQLVEELFGDAWPVAVAVATLLIGAATFVAARYGGAEEED